MPVRKLIAAALAVGVVAVTGCSMPEEPDSYSEQGQTTKEAKHKRKASSDKPTPKWVGHMNEISIGMSQADVKSVLGKPDDTDSFESEDFDGGTTVMDSWTYGDMFDDADGDDLWSLSFTDGKLDSKSRM